MAVRLDNRIYGFCKQCEEKVWRGSNHVKGDFNGLQKEVVHCVSCDGRSVDPLGNCTDRACLYQHGASKWQKFVKKIELVLGL